MIPDIDETQLSYPAPGSSGMKRIALNGFPDGYDGLTVMKNGLLIPGSPAGFRMREKMKL